MEDSTSYDFLKDIFSSVPVKAMHFGSRKFLQDNLDFKDPLESKSGYCRDYRGLGEQIGLPRIAIKRFERAESVTEAILDAWENEPNSTFAKLIEFLEEMERHDIIQGLVPILEKDARTYMDRKKVQELPIQDPEVSAGPESTYREREMQVYTQEDSATGKSTFYDAYMSYADGDLGFVLYIAEILESLGLKLYIHERDSLAGFAEQDIIIKLINERCRRMLIVLSPNYLKSPSCEFLASFAAGLAIDQQRRIMIPIIYEPCEVPLIFKYVSKIDFTKPDVQQWVWRKLISSLCPVNSSLLFTPSLEALMQSQNAPPASLASSKTIPMVTYPPTTKEVLCINIPSNSPATVMNQSEEATKNPTVPIKASSSPKKWKFPWRLKSLSSGYSSSHSVSTSSSATSGFHSQSINTLENLGNSAEDCSSDSPL